jgi:hypothetical protein
MTKADYLIIGLIYVIIFLGLQLQVAYSQQQSVEDTLKIAPLQSACGPIDSPCVDIIHQSNQSVVLKGNEFVGNTQPGGMEFMLNPGLWKIVDYYTGKGYTDNTILYIENEDVNSYRVILTK